MAKKIKTEAEDNMNLFAQKDFVVKLLQIIFTSVLLSIFVRLTQLSTLEELGKVAELSTWLEIIALAGIFTIMLLTLQIYIFFIRKDLKTNNKLLPIILVSLSLTFALSLVFGQTINIFVMPLSLSALLIATLVDRRLAIIANVLINQAFFLSYMMVFGSTMIIESAAALLAGVISGTFMIVFMEKTYTRLKFLVQSFIIGILISPVAMLSIILANDSSFSQVMIAGFWSFLSSMLSVALFMTILPVFEFIFKATTNFKLSEICSFDNPLLKKLSIEAPGTFNHSLIVGNLAEQCALAIGENAQLARAGAYYHDVGKLKNPEFFVENQKDGNNPHDDFIPEVSVSMITNHTIYGEAMLKKYNLPTAIANIAIEHHGTTLVNYFLYKAQNITEEHLKQKGFSYAGPKPSTKISAIIMIVDTVEAATRAVGIQSDFDEFRSFIHKLIKEKEDQGQFSDCPITFKNIQSIEDTLVEILPSMYHHRIAYKK